MLVKITTDDTPPADIWLTRPDWTSTSSLTDALQEPPVTLNGEAMIQQAQGLRADTLLTIARGNKTNVLGFHVRELFTTAAGCYAAGMTRWTETLPDGGTAYLYLGAPGETQVICEFDNVVIKSCSRVITGRSLLVGYELVGERIFALSDPSAAIGIRRNMTTFLFPGQLRAGQFGGMATFDVATALLSMDLCIDAPADADVVGALYNGNGVALGVGFTLAAGQRMARIELDPEVSIAADTSIVPVLASVGSADCPGQNLQMIVTVRQ